MTAVTRRARRALDRVDHDAQLHQVLVGRSTGRLDDEHIARAHVLLDFDRDLAIGKAGDRRLAQLGTEMRGNFLRQRRIGITGE